MKILDNILGAGFLIAAIVLIFREWPDVGSMKFWTMLILAKLSFIHADMDRD